MLRIPPEFQSTISTFSSFFSRPTFKKAKQLLLGAVVCPGSRTVCNVLRAIGLSQEKHFDKFHRVLSRAKYSTFKLSIHLLGQLVSAFSSKSEPLLFGVDETIERRRGSKINKKGVYRDPVRSSKSHFVKTTGLRWMSMMLLTRLPWLDEGIHWALPLFTALCPSKKFYEATGLRKPKKLTDWARQFICFLSRYAKPLNPNVYLVGDGSYCTYELMRTATEKGIGLVSRLKINSRLFHLPGPQPKGKRGPKPHMGARILAMEKRLTDKRIKWTEVIFSHWYGQTHKKMLITQGVSIWDSNKGYWEEIKWVLVKDPDGQLDPVLLATNEVELSAVKVVQYAVRRWRVEVTFAELRRHLGMETQRQWSELAIERTTPILMGLKSIVCLLALPLYNNGNLCPRTTAWYFKDRFTFSDILYSVRQRIWSEIKLSTSPETGKVESLRERVKFFQQTLALAVA